MTAPATNVIDLASPPTKTVVCPFTVIADTREQSPYLFSAFTTRSGRQTVLLQVPVRRFALLTGDYSILGMPQVAIERKTAADLYASVSRRTNFEERLARMATLAYAAVVIEAEWSELICRPPAFTKFKPKSLCRTIQAWTQRYPTIHWWTMPGREAAERLTFRLLERFWIDNTDRYEVDGQVVDGQVDDQTDEKLLSKDQADRLSDQLPNNAQTDGLHEA